MREWTTLKKYIWLFLLRGASAIIKTVTGTAPLVLENAIEAAIKSLKQFGKCTQPSGVWNTAITQYGKCEQNGTPTPDAPVDIMTNNGVLRYGALGSNLYDPSTAVFEIGYYYNPNTDGAQTAAQNNFIYHAYIPVEAGEAYVFYGRRKDDNRLSQYNRIHWYDAEKTYIATNTYVGGTIGKGVAPDNAVYARLSCNPQGASTAISEDTVLAYNWTFCKGTAEVTPFVPFVGGIYTDGTPETLKIIHNLYDANAVDPNHYYDPNGVYTETQTVQLSNRVPVKSGDVIVCTTKTAGTGGAINIRYNQLDTSGEWVSQEVQSQARNTTLAKTVTINQDGFFCFSGTFSGTTYVDFDTTVISIESETQTVSVPMLLGVNDAYRDEAELIGGLLTHKVGIKVFDGSEAWRASSSSNIYILDSAIAVNLTAICTHFQKVANTTSASNMRDGSFKGHPSNTILYFKDVSAGDVNGFKANLTAQYNAGTPVIVLYSLATETTEQGTAYPQLVNAKYNTASVTAEVSDIQVTFTTGEQTAPNPYSPLPIVCNNGELKWNGTTVVADGTPEVLTVSGANLLDPSASNIAIGQQVTANGEITLLYPNNWCTDYIPIVGGKTYAFWGRAKADNTISAYNRINWYTADKTHIPPRPSYTVDTVTVGTAPSNAVYAMLSCSPYKSNDAITREAFDLYNWMFAEAAQEIPYEPYVQPQTVTVPMLLGVGDYKDEAEIIQGIKTGKVGIYVFTGEEAITKGAAFYTSNTSFLPSKAGSIEPICTHFKGISSSASRVADSLTMTVNGPSGTFKGCVYFYADRSLYATAADFRAWLASEYAAGTPVIVIYPLATEITESGTEQPLTTSEGTNTVSVTSNVDPVELEIEYSASA